MQRSLKGIRVQTYMLECLLRGMKKEGKGNEKIEKERRDEERNYVQVHKLIKKEEKRKRKQEERNRQTNKQINNREKL